MVQGMPIPKLEQIVPSAANGFKSVSIKDPDIKPEQRKALIVDKIELELETDLDALANDDEFLFQIVTEEFSAEAFRDDIDCRFKKKQRFLIGAAGSLEVKQVYEWNGPVIIPSQEFWVQFQTVGQAAATTANVVLHRRYGKFNETEWGRLTT